MVYTLKSSTNDIEMSKHEKMDSKCQKPDSVHKSEETLATAEFVSLEKFTYKDSDGIMRTWEVASRVSKPGTGKPDCVGSLAVLRRMLKYDCIILVKQYRPALKKYTLEFPAGLLNSAELPAETAIRELQEETGYRCSAVKHISPLTALDPGLCDSTMQLVTLEVNGDLVENHFPKQCDHDCNAIEVIHIPVDEFLTRINEFAEQEIIIDSRVYCFAIGLTIGGKGVKPMANPY